MLEKNTSTLILLSGEGILFLTCPMGKCNFWRNSNYRRTVKSILLIEMFLGLVEMTFGLVYASFSLPEWQALKMTFLAPCWGGDKSFSV